MRILVASLLLLGACTPFPPAGTGGFAEHRATTEPPLYWSQSAVLSELREAVLAGRPNGVREPFLGPWLEFHLHELGCIDLALQDLLSQGARKRFPAAVWEAERNRVRVLRLTSAGLEHDALVARHAYRNSVETIAVRLDSRAQFVFGGASCAF
jgi:hypothetical protein